ncbi:MAG TPA: hypothetical protein VGC21_23045 [Telluria sp.]
MKYDDAEYFFLNFETDTLENEAGATHIGMFMAWIILHELVSEDHRARHGDELAQLKARQITGAQFVVDQLDCKLMDCDLSELGKAFAASYYASHYGPDYMQAMGINDDTADNFCSVADT